MVERWSPKPNVMGSTPFFPVWSVASGKTPAFGGVDR